MVPEIKNTIAMETRMVPGLWVQAVKAWADWKSDWRHQGLLLDQLIAVNERVNEEIEYQKEDLTVDHWQHPEELLSSKRGDCEDIALYKFGLLINQGFDPSRLWILVVNDLVVHQAHALVCVNHFGKNFYLDNRTTVLLSRLDEMIPVMAIDGTGKSYLFGRKVD